MYGEYCQFRLLTWTSLIGQLVHPVIGQGIGYKGGWGGSFYQSTTS